MKLLHLSLLLTLTACATVPGTGRRRLAPTMSIDQQLSLGAEAYDEALKDQKVISSGPEAEMVRRIGNRISQSSLMAELFPESSRFDWDFQLVDAPDTANAWVLPGGKCAVYTGLLPITQDEDGLAAVMGHEIAHAVAEHGAPAHAVNVCPQAGDIVFMSEGTSQCVPCVPCVPCDLLRPLYR